MFQTLYLDEKTDELCAIDQTLLPARREYLRISDIRTLYEAIRTLRMRGAPAIGVGAAIGLYACASRFEDITPEGFCYSFCKCCAYLRTARPTAKNLFYAIDKMQQAAEKSAGKTVQAMKKSLKKQALALFKEDIAVCHSIGAYGEKLLADGDVVLTHCNAGSLCAVEYGTALAPIYAAAEQGKKISVYADETRPLLQGARLTAYELHENGIDVTVECDGMAASLMAAGKISAVLVGCDRVAANGDFANKIGTLSVAVNASYFGVPFYVCAPFATIDADTASGKDIPIEQRDEKEVSEYWYAHRMTPEDVPSYNPAFDVTPYRLVTAFITERGVFTPQELQKELKP